MELDQIQPCRSLRRRQGGRRGSLHSFLLGNLIARAIKERSDSLPNPPPRCFNLRPAMQMAFPSGQRCQLHRPLSSKPAKRLAATSRPGRGTNRWAQSACTRSVGHMEVLSRSKTSFRVHRQQSTCHSTIDALDVQVPIPIIWFRSTWFLICCLVRPLNIKGILVICSLFCLFSHL